MGFVDREQLLSPISESEPSGADLGYDPAFAELEAAAQGKPEQRMGDSTVPGKPPDWSLVLELSVSLLQRTHDLRVAVYLSPALLQRNGFSGFAEGLALVQEMLTGFWTTLHPELDHDEQDDPIERITALSALCTPPLLASLRSTPLVRARMLGAVSLRDIQALGAEAPADGSSPAMTAATVEGIFREVALEELEAVAEALKQSTEALSGIDTVFETHTGSRGPDFAPLLQAFREASHALTPRLSARRAEASGSESEAQSQSAQEHEQGAAVKPGGVLSGEIRSREDVVRAIDKICAYYERSEPTSPLPLLLERCRRLVTSSFLDIIRDLAPDSLTDVERLGGTKPE
jgi:type VI secretion system protein ImpA